MKRWHRILIIAGSGSLAAGNVLYSSCASPEHSRYVPDPEYDRRMRSEAGDANARGLLTRFGEDYHPPMQD